MQTKNQEIVYIQKMTVLILVLGAQTVLSIEL